MIVAAAAVAAVMEMAVASAEMAEATDRVNEANRILVKTNGAG